MSIFKQYDFASYSNSTISVQANSIIGFSLDEKDFMSNASIASTVLPQNFSIQFTKENSTVPIKIELGKTFMYETDDFIKDSGVLIIPENPPKSLKINIITFQEGGSN